MELCSRCHKHPAVVFITKIENNKTVNEGLCLKCARDLGIPQIDAIMKSNGITDDDIDRMSDEMENMLTELAPDEGFDESESRAPAIDFQKLFSQASGLFQNPKDKGEDGKAQGEKAAPPPRQKGKKYLDQYCLDLTARARDGKLDRIIGRDRELARVIQILCRRQKNNPCLIGEPGVGKTTIAEALALRIAEGNAPYQLANKSVYLVDLTAIVAGTQFRGQFESRMKGLIEEVKARGDVILVIDEVHSIVGAGDSEGSMNAANILKPALSRGEIQVIGATTLAEYRKYIEKDAALERRFQSVMVDEPSIEDSIKILEGIKGYYEQFHGIKIPDETIVRAVTLSERYITDRFLPDKAIDLLDEASSYLALNSPCIENSKKLEAQLCDCKKEHERLDAAVAAETDEGKRDENYRALADIRTRELNVQSELDECNKQREEVILTTEALAKVIEVWTGIPASSITEHEFVRIDKLEERLKSRIIGQDAAISAVARAIKRSRAGISYKRKPVSFIFAGPTGVGKTELVKTLAADLFDSPETLIRLDMSEFMEKHSVSRIIGAPPGYVGYDEAGQLTEKIRRKPYSVILFDEIEKAHPDVLNVLLQILDDGRVTDAHGKTVSFENTVIVMTTNAGSNLNLNTPGFGSSSAQLSAERTQKALADFLRPEFINRVDEIVTFNPLERQDFAAIARIMLNDLKRALAEKDIALSFTEAAEVTIADKSFSAKFGARNMRRFIQSNIEDVIAERIISGYDNRPNEFLIDAENGELIIK